MSFGFPDPNAQLRTALQILSLRRQREIDQRNRLAKERSAALQILSVSPETNLDKMRALFPALSSDPGQIDALKEIQRGIKTRQKRQQQLGQVQGLAQFVASGPTGPELNTALSGIADNPEALRQLSARIPVAQQARRARQVESEQQRRRAIGQGERLIEDVFGRSGEAATGARLALLNRMLRGPTRQFERVVGDLEASGFYTPEQADTLRDLFVRNQALGQQGFNIRTLPDGTVEMSQGGSVLAGQARAQRNLVSRLQNIRRIQEDLGDMITRLEADPTRGGASARIRNAIQGGAGLAESLLEVTGSDALLDLARQGQAKLRSVIDSGTADPRFESRFKRFVEDPSIPILEQQEVFLAIGLADILRGAGRLAVGLVDQVREVLNFKDIRGSESVISRLRDLQRRLSKRDRDLRESAEQMGISIPERLERRFQGQSAPTFTVNPQGTNLVPARP